MNTAQPDADRKRNRSADFQTAFADYVRGGVQIPEGMDTRRLDVYRRLLLNNLCSFLDLCFSGSSGFAEPQMWRGLQEGFLLEARPQSPFFNDIPKQFLDYAASRHPPRRPSENVLAVMAFETDLLHAETAVQDEPLPLWDSETVLLWAQGARLKRYRCDFVSSGLEKIEDRSCDVLTWRDGGGQVYYRTVGGTDLFLLNHFQEAKADTLSALSARLSALSDGLDAEAWLAETIDAWVEAGVLLPVQNQTL